MRPPVLPSGNSLIVGSTEHARERLAASMRPPVLPSGNCHSSGERSVGPDASRFNEAAGFTQRKHQDVEEDALDLVLLQ